MKQYFLDLFKNYIGPILVAAVCVNGYWAYNTIQIQQAALEALQVQTQELSLAIGNQCQAMLESKGFTVEKKKVEVEEN